MGFIVTNWNKSQWQYLLQVREGGFIICGIFIVERAKLFSKVAGQSWRVQNKVWLVSLLSLLLTFREFQLFVCRKRNILLNKHLFLGEANLFC